jgi:hypothetical protein
MHLRETVLRLYHYTSVPLAGCILNTELKSVWPYTTEDQRQVRPCIWLTTSPEPYGHGLPNGQDHTESQMAQLKKRGRIVKNAATHNKYLVRFQLESDALSKWSVTDSGLSGVIPYVKFSKWLGESNRWRQYMGLSGLFDLDALSDEELRRHLARTKTMENTWWLYFGNIPIDLIDEVSFKTGRVYVPYDFELHGRAEFAKSGQHMASKASLDEFHKICGPKNRFETPQAMVSCVSASSKPSVTFQAGGAAWEIDLATFIPTASIGDLPKNIAAVIEWTKIHREELVALWPTAVETYNLHNPASPI